MFVVLLNNKQTNTLKVENYLLNKKIMTLTYRNLM